jgi:integral membrane protein
MHEDDDSGALPILRGVKRAVWLALGFLCVGLGGIGVVVPGLPTTVFFVMAAACFSRSSPRFEQWVLTRPGVGPLVRDYRAGLGMPKRAKIAAVSSIVVMCGLSAGFAVGTWWARLLIVVAGAVGVGWIVWRIPTRAAARPDETRARADSWILWFRGAAVAEALSWCGLLIGMFAKYVLDRGDRGVEVFGQIHGVVVLVYAAAALVMWRRQHWSSRTLVLALLASVPPLGSIVFERWATRSGQLEPPRWIPPRPTPVARHDQPAG